MADNKKKIESLVKSFNKEGNDKPLKNKDTLGEETIEEWNTLLGYRLSIDQSFRDAAYYFMPSVYEYVVWNKERNYDTGRHGISVDAIGIDVVNELASALYSNTIATGTPWFTLRAANEELNNDSAVSGWYSKVTDIALKAIQNSNFSMKIFESLKFSVTFGTGIIHSEYLEKSEKLNFSTMRISDCVIAENKEGLIETLFYKMNLSPIQAYQKWGDKCPHEVIERAHTKNKHTPESYIRCIKARETYKKESMLSKDMPFMDVIIHENMKAVVDVGGHNDFPLAVHRFDRVEGTAYGRCPSFDALDTIQMVNRMMDDTIDSVELLAQPPVFTPMGVDPESISLSPGAVNPYNADGGEVKWINFGIDLNGTMAVTQRYEQQIRDIFLVDKFVAMEDQSNMTATEVVERRDEKIQSVSPVVARMQSELLEPLIERVVRLLVENGRTPEVPEVLLQGDNEFKVEYTTRMDAKLAEIETNNLLQAINEASLALQKIQEIPELGVILNADLVVNTIMKNHNVDPDITRSKNEIEEIRNLNAEMQKEAMERQALIDKTKPIDLQRAPDEGSPAADSL